MEFSSINVDNKAHNVIPARAIARFNIRYNNLHTSNSLKILITDLVRKISKKNKCNFKIKYLANGDAFITNPEKTIFSQK